MSDLSEIAFGRENNTPVKTLRDEFAINFDIPDSLFKSYMDILYRKLPAEAPPPTIDEILYYTALIKYRFADAMMKERDKK